MPRWDQKINVGDSLTERGLHETGLLRQRLLEEEEFAAFDTSSISSAPETWAKLTASLISGIGVEDLDIRAVLGDPETGLNRRELTPLLKKGEVPAVGITSARQLIANLPPSDFLVAGGTVIAGLYSILGLYRNDPNHTYSLLPDFGEAVIMDIPPPSTRR